jgi:hypothetical protein
VIGIGGGDAGAAINASNVAPVSGISMLWVFGVGYFTSVAIGLMVLLRLARAFTGNVSVAGATEIEQASAMTLRSRQPPSPIRASAVIVARRVALSVARMFAMGAETRMQVRPVNRSE